MSDTTAISVPLRVLDLKPRREQGVKPAELIQITGHQGLTLNARRAITILWHNAHLQGVEEGRDYTIEIDDLKPDHHKGYPCSRSAAESEPDAASVTHRRRPFLTPDYPTSDALSFPRFFHFWEVTVLWHSPKTSLLRPENLTGVPESFTFALLTV